MGTLISRAALAAVVLAGCSPEARRTRDGGPGADPGNKDLVDVPVVEPQAADTTLWPGRAPAPVERFTRGELPPPSYPGNTRGPAKQQRTFDRDPSVDPREPNGAEE